MRPPRMELMNSMEYLLFLMIMCGSLRKRRRGTRSLAMPTTTKRIKSGNFYSSLYNCRNGGYDKKAPMGIVENVLVVRNGEFKFWPTRNSSLRECNGGDKIHGLDKRGNIKKWECNNDNERTRNNSQTRQFRNQRIVTVARARETVGNQEEKGVPLRAEQGNWLDDTDDESDEQELEAHYTQHSEQLESINDIYVVEKVDSNVIPDSSDMCDNEEKADQNAEDDEDERVEMLEDLEYAQSLEKEVDELESEKAEFSNEYDLLLQECVLMDIMCSILRSFESLDEKN
ncbi:hypothetical protein Tco_1476232 [Tanacetum coccineum]